MDPIQVSPCSLGDTHCQEVIENIPLDPSYCNKLLTALESAACVVIPRHCSGMVERPIKIQNLK